MNADDPNNRTAAQKIQEALDILRIEKLREMVDIEAEQNELIAKRNVLLGKTSDIAYELAKRASERNRIELRNTQVIKDYTSALTSDVGSLHSDLSSRLEGEKKVHEMTLANFDLETKKLKFQEKYGSIVTKWYEKSKDYLSQIGHLIVNPWALLAAGLAEGVVRFKQLDKAAEEFRKSTGLTISSTSVIRANAELINIQFQEMGVSIEKSYEAAAALANVFGAASAASFDNMKQVALMSVNLGVAEEDSANVLQNFVGMGKASDETARNIIAIGAHLVKGTGISFAKVMHDVATASSVTVAMIGASPKKLMAAAISARILGVDLNTAAGNARRLLDFDSSINAEMDASALLGRNINFQYARQLAFQGDILGAEQEALKVVKQAGDWNRMTVYQREALAKASGMEVKDMTKMLAMDRIRNSTGPLAKKLSLLEAQRKSLEGILGSEDEQLVNQAQQELLDKEMQGRITNITNSLKKMLISIGTLFQPIINVLADKVIPFLSTISNWIEKVVGESNAWVGSILAITLAVGGLRIAFFTFGKMFSGIGSLLAKPFQMLGGATKVLGGATKELAGAAGSEGGGIFQSIARGIGYFGKPNVLLGVASMAIMAGTIWVLAKALQEFNSVNWESLGKAGVALVALGVAGAVFGALSEILIPGAIAIAALGLAMIPFAGAAWITAKAMQALAPSIVSMIDPLIKLAGSAGGLMLAAAGVAAIGAAMELFGAGAGLGSIIGKLTGGNGMIEKLSQLSSLGDGLMRTATAIERIATALSSINNIGNVAIAGAVTPINIESSQALTNKLSSPASSSPSQVVKTTDDSTASSLDALAKAVSDLTNLMKSGGISVNLDGRLVSKTLAGNY